MPPCRDFNWEKRSWEESETESCATSNHESSAMADVSVTEMEMYSEVISAGIAEGVESQNDCAWPNISLIPGLWDTLMGDETELLGNGEWEQWPADNLQVPGLEVEDLSMHDIDEEIPVCDLRFGFCFGDHSSHSNELGLTGSSSIDGINHDMGNLTMVSMSEDQLWNTFIDMDGGGTNCNGK